MEPSDHVFPVDYCAGKPVAEKPEQRLSAEQLKEELRLQRAYAKRLDGDRYSRFNAGNLYILHQRENVFLSLLVRYGYSSLASKKILEIGCGSGDFLRDLIKWGGRPENLTGIDVLPDRIAEARRLCPKDVRIEQANAASLNYPTEHFDLVVQSTVFTSVLDRQVRFQMAAEMRRVVKSNGLILWYDYHVNNPRNKDVRGVKRREIHELFPGCHVELKRITLLPPFTERVAPYSRLLCYVLEKIPWLCTHYIGVIQKKDFL
jgi:ubiquinone/menaquinone biosynthesis C-methylase UbiE